MNRLGAFGLSALLALSCGTPREELADAPSLIIGGTADTLDPAVVLIIAIAPSGDGTICTGTVVSPHVVATAAHCVSPDVIGGLIGHDYEFQIFLGDDNNDPAQYNDVQNFVPVTSTVYDTAYPLTGMPTHDVGALVTATALPVAPIPIHRAALGAKAVGTAVRILGYGRTKANDVNSSAAKFEADATIAGIGDEQMYFEGSPGLCEGDSGGPTLITVNGVESLAGIHSYGDATSCIGKSYDMRVDVDLPALIDPLIAENDPDFVPPTDGSTPNGGGGAGGSGGSAGHSGESEARDDSGCSVGSSSSTASGCWQLLIALSTLASWSRRRKIANAWPPSSPIPSTSGRFARRPRSRSGCPRTTRALPRSG